MPFPSRSLALGLVLLLQPVFAEPPARDADTTFGLLRDLPVYMQEWHVWWGFPYPDPGKGVAHLGTSYTSFREPWRLDWDRNGYPFVGLYDSSNPEIIRWQLRCMKATGITSTAIMLHPEADAGLTFIQEEFGLVRQLLDLAAKEGFPVFFMDEVAFRETPAPKDPAIMARRVAGFLKRYASHPGFYKIDGKPVYYYQTYGYDITPGQTGRMMADAEAAYGAPIHWMIFGSHTEMSKVDRLATLVSGANIHRKSPQTRQLDLAKQDPREIFRIVRAAGKKAGDIHYPKFDGTAQSWRQRRVAQYGDQGRFLETTLASSLQAKPDLLMLSSWNDYEEGASFEPAWDFDGFTGDPYLFCRVLAHLRGREFVPPPLPPKEAVHPSIWEKLGYGDGAGPIIEVVHRSHTRGGSLEIVARDSVSAVTGLEVVWDGDLWWRAAQAGETAAGGNLRPAENAFGESARAISVVGLNAGAAAPVRNGSVAFRSLVDPSVLGPLPAVGVAYALDPLNPARLDLDTVNVRLPRVHPARMWEPAGAVQRDVILRLSPHNKPDDIGAQTWEGWITRSAAAYVPVALSEKADCVVVQAAETRLATVSLLGPPRAERLLASPGEARDPARLRVAYHLPIPGERLDRPGVQFVWLRARDAAGNWGSPILYSFPNYEEIPKDATSAPSTSAPALAPSFQPEPGALFADDFRTLAKWKTPGAAAPQGKARNSSVAIGNGVLSAPLAKPVAAFTVKFKVRHTEWQRAVTLWVTDAVGGKGYGLVWDSSIEGQFNGQGLVALFRLNQETPPAFGTRGDRLGDIAASGHPALSSGFAELTLKRFANGSLFVEVDGVTVLSVIDPTWNNFENIHLVGNGASLFGPVQVIEGATP